MKNFQPNDIVEYQRMLCRIIGPDDADRNYYLCEILNTTTTSVHRASFSFVLGPVIAKTEVDWLLAVMKGNYEVPSK